MEIWRQIKCYDSSKERLLVWMIKIAIKTAVHLAKTSNIEITAETIIRKNLVYSKNIEAN